MKVVGQIYWHLLILIHQFLSSFDHFVSIISQSLATRCHGLSWTDGIFFYCLTHFTKMKKKIQLKRKIMLNPWI